MAHDHAARTASTEAADSTSSGAGHQGNAEAFVVRLLQQHGPYVGPLAEAIKKAGRAGDQDVALALQRHLGNSLAHDVIMKSTATTARHGGVDTHGAHGELARDTQESDAVNKTKGVSADVHGNAATVHAAGGKTTTDETGSHSTKGGVSAGREGDDNQVGADVARSTTTPDGTTSTHGVGGKAGLGPQGPSGSINHTRSKTTAHTNDAGTTTHTADASTTSLGVDKDGVTATAGRTASATTAGGGNASAGVTGSVQLGDTQGVAVGGSAGGTNANGLGAHVGFHFENSRTKHEQTKNGMTTLEIDTHVAAEVSAGVDIKHVGVHGSKSEGKDSHFVASVPEAKAKGLNLAKLDPSSPEALPIGASLRVDSAKFKGTSLGVTLEGLGASSAQTRSKGTSLLIEKLDGTHVRVTEGPTEAISQVTSFGVDFGVAGVALLGSTHLSQGTLHSAELDISVPEGVAAYGKLVGSGHIPPAEGAGVTKVTKIERLDESSQASIGGHIGPLSGALHGEKSEAHFITVTHADGSKEIDNAAGEGDKRSEYHERLDPKGKTTEEAFTLVLRNHDTVDQLLRVLPGAKLKPKAKEFRLELTHSELTALYQLAKRAAEVMHKLSKGMDNMDPLVRVLEGSSGATDFFSNFSRAANSFEQAYILEQISDLLDGKLDGKFAALPGHIA